MIDLNGSNFGAEGVCRRVYFLGSEFCKASRTFRREWWYFFAMARMLSRSRCARRILP